MRITPPSGPRDRQGYALIVTLVVLAITLVTLSSLMWWASANGKVTRQNELFTTAESAADAAAETVVATMDRDWTYSQALQSANIYAHLSLPDQTAWPMNFQFSDGSGNNGVIGVSIAVTNNYGAVGSEFAGLSAYILPCTITSSARTLNQIYTVTATVQEVINATVIPLFQFAIFYNMNLEIDPGATMLISGPVFCNQGIWTGTPNVAFNSSVSAAGWVYDQATDPTNANPWAIGKSDTGTPSGNFSIQPLFGRDSLTLPIGNSTNNTPSAVETIINLPVGTNGAPNPYAYTAYGQTYLFNESDLIISNAAAGLAGPGSVTNITIWYQDPNNPTSYLTPITNDFYALKTGSATNVLSPNPGINNISNVQYAGYSFVTNVSYYDFRELDTVQAVQVDVGKLNVWLTNTATTGGNQYNRTSFQDNGHGIRSIYVYNNVRPASGILPAVRMVNGQQLPFTTDPGGSGATTSGLTVSTPQPLYIKGDYNVQTATSAAGAAAQTTNTANTYPAALIGDAITILSTNWQDGGSAYLAAGFSPTAPNPPPPQSMPPHWKASCNPPTPIIAAELRTSCGWRKTGAAWSSNITARLW